MPLDATTLQAAAAKEEAAVASAEVNCCPPPPSFPPFTPSTSTLQPLYSPFMYRTARSTPHGLSHGPPHGLPPTPVGVRSGAGPGNKGVGVWGHGSLHITRPTN